MCGSPTGSVSDVVIGNRDEDFLNYVADDVRRQHGGGGSINRRTDLAQELFSSSGSGFVVNARLNRFAPRTPAMPVLRRRNAIAIATRLSLTLAIALSRRSRLDREIWLDDVEALRDGGLALSAQSHRLLGLTTILIDLCETMALKAVVGLRAIPSSRPAMSN